MAKSNSKPGDQSSVRGSPYVEEKADKVKTFELMSAMERDPLGGLEGESAHEEDDNVESCMGA
ncbi:hypothetical protein Ancab_025367, partial [Ancistrocladus abbreviatus]